MVKTLSEATPLGSPAPTFSLPNTNPNCGGPVVALDDYRDSQGLLVAFICNHCPYVIHLRDALATFASGFQAQGLAVVAISSNDAVNYPEDRPERMTAIAADCGFSFPYLYDESQEIARSYGAVCTPDFFLYDGDHRLRYHGRFDASTPGNNQAISGADLEAAVRAVLAGEEPSADQKPSVGCSIKWK